MKIGLSYSRCVRDIFEGKVPIEQVLVIIARTNFDPYNEDEWGNIWYGYTQYNGIVMHEWANYLNHEEDFKKITLDLWDSGKLHQPRKFGKYVMKSEHVWYDVILTPEAHETNPAALQAYERYRLLLGLS